MSKGGARMETDDRLSTMQDRIREIQRLVARAQQVTGEERAFVLRCLVATLDDLRRQASMVIAECEDWEQNGASETGGFANGQEATAGNG